MKEALPASATGKPIEIWFQDEARVGQKGTLEYIWAPVGSRPRGVRDNRHDSVYLFGALCAYRAVGAAVIMPAANSEAMSVHLKEISLRCRLRACGPGLRRGRVASTRRQTDCPGQHHIAAAASIFPRTEPDGKRMGLPAWQQTQPHSMGHL